MVARRILGLLGIAALLLPALQAAAEDARPTTAPLQGMMASPPIHIIEARMGTGSTANPDEADIRLHDSTPSRPPLFLAGGSCNRGETTPTGS